MDKRLEGISNEELIKAVIENIVIELGHINKISLSEDNIKNIIENVYKYGPTHEDEPYDYNIFLAVNDELEDYYKEEEDDEEFNKNEDDEFGRLDVYDEDFNPINLSNVDKVKLRNMLIDSGEFEDDEYKN